MFKKTMLFSLVLCGLQVHAANITQVSRYATVNNQPLAAQINPMKTVLSISVEN